MWLGPLKIICGGGEVPVRKQQEILFHYSYSMNGCEPCGKLCTFVGNKCDNESLSLYLT